jgi:hypothetical protein
MKSIITGAMLALMVTTAEAQTGNEMYQGCRLLSQHELPKTITDALNTGFCAGLITAINDSHSLVCPPEGTNATQSAAVLMRFMDEHPEIRHEDVYVITVMALRNAWPCKPQ